MNIDRTYGGEELLITLRTKARHTFIHRFITQGTFKDELIQVMNEKSDDTLTSYMIGIKSNKHLRTYITVMKGFKHKYKLKDIY